MIELLKKTILTGIGIVSLTRDRIEDLSQKISKEAKLSEEEGKKLAEDLLHESEKVKKNLETHIETVVKKIHEKLNIAAGKELQSLQARIEILENKLACEERDNE